MEVVNSKFNKHKGRANVGPLFWTILGVVITALSLIATCVGIVVSVNAYNHRYDANASAAGGLEFTLQGKTETSGTFVCSAGELTYGYFQKSGKEYTNYVLKYKETSNSSFKTLKSEFTIAHNNDYYGSYYMAKNSNSKSYDIKLIKKNNQSNKTVFEFDWGV